MQLYASCHSGLLTPAAVLDALGRRKLADSASLLHPIQTRMLVQFPEKRLIQYDCGKWREFIKFIQFYIAVIDNNYLHPECL